MAVQSVLVCSSVLDQGDGSFSCASQEWVSAYLLSPELAGSLELIETGGFSAQFFGLGFTAVLMAFAVGLGVGLVIHALRALK